MPDQILLLSVYYYGTAKARAKTAKNRHIPKQTALREIAGLVNRQILKKFGFNYGSPVAQCFRKRSRSTCGLAAWLRVVSVRRHRGRAWQGFRGIDNRALCVSVIRELEFGSRE